MQCTSQLQAKSKSGVVVNIPCGMCTACRIKKRSSWVLRNYLEASTSISQSFWTLTFDQNNLPDIDTLKLNFRRFLERLRYREGQAGNQMPIRYFGCVDFGGSFGRPHLHLMLYNLMATYREPPAYNRGLPRPRQHIDLWPHGSVDIAEYNTATLNYVTDYVLPQGKEHYETGLKPFRVSTRNPAIGYYGILKQAASLAAKSQNVLSMPDCMVIHGRSFPLDTWTREHLRKALRKAGVKVLEHSIDPIQRKRDRDLIASDLQNAIPWYWHMRTIEKERHYEEAQARKARQKQLLEEGATRRYLARYPEAARLFESPLGDSASWRDDQCSPSPTGPKDRGCQDETG